MKNQLDIKNLHVSTISGKEILKGVSLSVKRGEIHAIMGPNGGGKSTFAQSLMGHPQYSITSGKISIDNTDITTLSPDQKAKHGLFLAFQYPVEIPGVSFSSFLRMAVNESKEKKLSPIAFRNLLSEKSENLFFSHDITKRMLNEGFSGGEKKKAEILQMNLLSPKFAILDEPDSGLDVDSLRVIAESLNKIEEKPGIILITHYQRILHYVKPDFVHVLINGKIVKSGNASLAKEIEEKGYKEFSK